MEGVVRSDHHASHQSKDHSAKLIMRLPEKPGSLPILPNPFTTDAPTLLRFLEPEVTALQILRSASREEENLFDLARMLVSVLKRVLRPGDRLQSRALGLELFPGYGVVGHHYHCVMELHTRHALGLWMSSEIHSSQMRSNLPPSPTSIGSILSGYYWALHHPTRGGVISNL
ncbi:hypothetical protein BDM02DRAFT_1938603 [Thelephora ganbajun]|uniref:Uncharacterized protein n=1 Tax=Thelephora ganbajun TaxID=370292 RepID=A0ACB6ZIF3_THEGA|nr:hypothetical protein BDM02DRAFT_1938603 [Thelephora ganbajun]